MTFTYRDGEYRRLTRSERAFLNGYSGKRYKYVVTKEYSIKLGDNRLRIPKGFLTDGATGGPDWGTSWMYHDYLYGTHGWDNGVKICRREADDIMCRVLKEEKRPFYRFLFKAVSRLNPFGLFSRAWRNGEERGVEFLNVKVHGK